MDLGGKGWQENLPGRNILDMELKKWILIYRRGRSSHFSLLSSVRERMTFYYSSWLITMMKWRECPLEYFSLFNICSLIREYFWLRLSSVRFWSSLISCAAWACYLVLRLSSFNCKVRIICFHFTGLLWVLCEIKHVKSLGGAWNIVIYTC